MLIEILQYSDVTADLLRRLRGLACRRAFHHLLSGREHFLQGQVLDTGKASVVQASLSL